jgi:hypothetical protein
VKLLFATLALLAAAPAYAQLDVRPFVQFADERYAASKTFNALFETNTVPSWGGGVELVVHRRFFAEVAMSRMSKTGQRFFLDDSLNVFRLGIASHVTITPVEVSGGYRFGKQNARVRPYASAGIGWYRYVQVDDFSDPSENVDQTHVGFAATGGLEVRIARWIGIAGDARFTHVAGILGQGGKTSGSQVANETDLGGVAARIRVILGR